MCVCVRVRVCVCLTSRSPSASSATTSTTDGPPCIMRTGAGLARPGCGRSYGRAAAAAATAAAALNAVFSSSESFMRPAAGLGEKSFGCVDEVSSSRICSESVYEGRSGLRG